MAGASIRLDVDTDDERIQRDVEGFRRRAANLTPARREIGEHLLNTTLERFDTATSPQGEPWAALSTAYQARKRRNRNRILVYRDLLRGLMRYQLVGRSGVAVGTDRIYGATHQFGDDARGIPARPYLGLSADDERAVIEIVTDYLNGR